MMTVYDGKSIQEISGIYSTPVLYIIGKNGKVLYNLAGYSDNLLEEVERIITENL